MESSTSNKFKLGLFVILSTMLLVIALYFIGNRQNLFGKTFRISAVFNNVNGLQLGNNVRFSGINVGTVKAITMQNDSTISVDMIVDEKMLQHLKKNAVATIGSDGLVGSMIINIVPTGGFAEQITDGDTLGSYSKISTNDMLTTLSNTNENAALLTADLLKITSAINKGEGTLGLLITDKKMAENLKSTMSNLKTASNTASNTLVDLNEIIKAVDYKQSLAAVILSDSIQAHKMRTIISNFEGSSAKIDTVLYHLDELFLEIKEGKGTFNYLVTDTTLVNDINQTMKNIKQGSILLNQDLEALKHNFLFRGYFKKLERQKKKEAKKKASVNGKTN